MLKEAQEAQKPVLKPGREDLCRPQGSARDCFTWQLQPRGAASASSAWRHLLLGLRQRAGRPCPLAPACCEWPALGCCGHIALPISYFCSIGFCRCEGFWKGSCSCIWLQKVGQVGSWSSLLELHVWLHLSCLRCFLQTVFEGQNWDCLGAGLKQ